MAWQESLQGDTEGVVGMAMMISVSRSSAVGEWSGVAQRALSLEDMQDTAINVLQTKHDGQFKTQRKRVSQFYMSAAEAAAVQQELNGVHCIEDFPQPTLKARDAGFEADCFATA